MTTVSQLQALSLDLVNAMQSDPWLSLVTTISWLDPFYGTAIETADWEESCLESAVTVCRQIFPTCYSELIHSGFVHASPSEREQQVLDALNAELYAPLGALDEVDYGLPIEAYGLDLTESEIVDHPNFEQISALLVALDVAAPLPLDYTSYDQLRNAVEAYLSATPPHGPCHHLLTWLFSLSGNSLVDYSPLELWEMNMDSPSWTAGDVAFLAEIHAEARQWLSQAQEQLHHISQDVTPLVPLLTYLRTHYDHSSNDFTNLAQ